MRTWSCTQSWSRTSSPANTTICGARCRRSASALHVLQTLPGILTIIVAAIGGALGALAGLALAIPPLGMVLLAAFVFVAVVVLMGLWTRGSFGRTDPILM